MVDYQPDGRPPWKSALSKDVWLEYSPLAYARAITTESAKPGLQTMVRVLDLRSWKDFGARSRNADPTECWPWIGKSLSYGYGIIGMGGRRSGKVLAHRVVWMFEHGPVPRPKKSRLDRHGTVIRHKCHNRLCCNPAHLEIGSQTENVADMWSNKGGPRGNARLTEDQVKAIRNDPRSSRQIALAYGVSDAHIRSIRQGRCWK